MYRREHSTHGNVYQYTGHTISNTQTGSIKLEATRSALGICATVNVSVAINKTYVANAEDHHMSQKVIRARSWDRERCDHAKKGRVGCRGRGKEAVPKQKTAGRHGLPVGRKSRCDDWKMTAGKGRRDKGTLNFYQQLFFEIFQLCIFNINGHVTFIYL